MMMMMDDDDDDDDDDDNDDDDHRDSELGQMLIACSILSHNRFTVPCL